MKRTIILFLLVLMIASCSTSRITHSWRRGSLQQPAMYKKILVFGIYSGADKNVKESMELHMAGDLNALGYKAVPASRQLGRDALRRLGEEAAINKLKKSDFDAVLTIVLLNKWKERRYVPARVYFTPYEINQRRFWGYYTTIYGRIEAAGYYTTDTKYFWESNLYNLPSGELVYSVQTESFNPQSSENMAHDYGRLIVKDLVRNKVITQRETATGKTAWRR
jgi:hypothetical protein